MKQTIFYLLLLALLLTVRFVHGQSIRQEHTLNGTWLFITDPERIGETAHWSQGLPQQSLQVRVPNTWNVMKGYEDYVGMAWYEKKFFIPVEWKDKQVLLKFGAVYHDAGIYINGQKISEHNNSGYTTFYVDIGKHLKYGDSNRLSVSVSNAYTNVNLPFKKSFDWPGDGGIIRDVSLMISGRPSIRYVHVTPKIRFPDRTALLGIELQLREENVRRIHAVITIREKKSARLVVSQSTTLSKKGPSFFTTLDAGKVHLWHFNDPFLYEIQVTLKQQEKATDEVVSTFGCRSVKVVGSRFLLNNEAVRLPGIEYMPSSHPDYGSAEPQWIMDSVVNLFKDLNVTISRFHWQVDEHMLDQMDEKGILLQAEIPWWQQPDKLTPELVKTAKSQFSEMIERDYNHPCLFAWGISNEVYGPNRDSAQYASLKEYVKSLDSTRLVNVVSNETFKRKEKDESLIGDVPTWNEYVGTWFGKSKDELPSYFQQIEGFVNGRPLLITENGLCEPRFSGGDLRRSEDMVYHYQQWAMRDYILGCIYFCLNDYRTHMGEEGVGRFKARVHGITDLYLKKKPSYYVFKQLASPIEIVAVKKINDQKVRVELKNKNSLPSYTVAGYKIVWQSSEGTQQVRELPMLPPGGLVTMELNHMGGRCVFDLVAPAGNKVASYPVVQ